MEINSLYDENDDQSSLEFDTTNANDQVYNVYFKPTKDLSTDDFIALKLPSLYNIDENYGEETGETYFKLVNTKQEEEANKS